MKTTLRLLGGVLLATAMFPQSAAKAHIKMLQPAPWIVEDDGVGGFGGGNPQKAGPCGPGANDAKMLTNTVTTFKAGETITVKWSETIAHPGYFRISLAENRADLLDPSLKFDSNCNVDHSLIPKGPHDNVLADGILIQEPNGAARPGSPNYTFEVKLPEKPCEKCTLQLIQFMEAHPPSCIYYHCADIKIVAGGAASGGTDAGIATSGDAGAASSTGMATTGATDGGTHSTTGSTVDAALPSGSGTSVPLPGVTGNAPDAGSVVASGSDAGTASATPATAAARPDDGGCSVAFGGTGSTGAIAGFGLALVGLVLRRRRQR
jgi:MYXO-CTERM domain-containing protein